MARSWLWTWLIQTRWSSEFPVYVSRSQDENSWGPFFPGPANVKRKQGIFPHPVNRVEISGRNSRILHNDCFPHRDRRIAKGRRNPIGKSREEVNHATGVTRSKGRY